jgi:RND family efflux transporter MFP subunit
MIACTGKARRRFRILALLGAGVLAGAACSPSPAQPADPGKTTGPARIEADKPITVKTVRPLRESLKREITQPAQVLPYEQTDIFAKVSGYLRNIEVDIGDRVKEGQTLAELSVPELEQERAQKEALVVQAQAEVRQALAAVQAAAALVDAAKAKLKEAEKDQKRFQAEAEFRKLEYDRYERLAQDRTVSQDLADEKLKQLQAATAAVESAAAAVESSAATVQVEEARRRKAEADHQSAGAHLEVAKANLEQVKTMLGYTVIRAPYAGLVTRRNVHTGAFIQSAASVARPEPLLTLLRVDRLRIVSDIPRDEARWVKPGQLAALQMKEMLSKPAGTVTRIAGMLDVQTRTLRAETELTRVPADLRPGMFGYLTITVVNDPKALLLPRAALVLTGGKPQVFVVEAGRARLRDIEVGFSDDTRVHVTGGLKGDELVIVPDQKNPVQDGQAILTER